jgi:hypothetical protein
MPEPTDEPLIILAANDHIAYLYGRQGLKTFIVFFRELDGFRSKSNYDVKSLLKGRNLDSFWIRQAAYTVKVYLGPRGLNIDQFIDMSKMHENGDKIK